MQLVAYGSQDVYLTGNPQITFFKAVYKRHTNFAMECIQQVFNGTPSRGAKSSVTVSRNGDLVHEVFLKFKTGTPLKYDAAADGEIEQESMAASWPVECGVSEVELSIGGQSIDKHTREWFRLRDELYHNETQKKQYSKMTCPGRSYRDFVTSGLEGDLFLPFNFSFNVHPGLALPLIALQYHEVKLDVTFAATIDSTLGELTSGNVEMWANYVYLDTDERRKFAQNQHEYLIEQVQRQQESSVTGQSGKNVRLNFNHPVKELIWAFQRGNPVNYDAAAVADRGGPWGNFANCGLVSRFTGGNGQSLVGDSDGAEGPLDQDGVIRQRACGEGGATSGAGEVSESTSVECAHGPLLSFKLQLNGHDRFSEQSSDYFNKVQPAFHHSGSPSAGVYCYSFALKPENHQPSGSCNFSRIDNATAVIKKKIPSTLTDSCSTLNMYAVNYNVLRIMSGMGGLAYSN
jgi:hypothetical protein